MANNIIFYFTDQQRWDTRGCYGQPLDITPNLDKLAAEGVKFENAFSPQPVCGPCRALFQTGRYPTETGCFRNNVMLPKGIKTLGEGLEAIQVWMSDCLTAEEKEAAMWKIKNEPHYVFSDNILCEAFVHKTLPAFGIQWHPELIYLSPQPGTLDPVKFFEYFAYLVRRESRKRNEK